MTQKTTKPVERDAEQHRRIERARVAIGLDDPFFGSMLATMRVGERIDIPTFCTDGTWIWYSPKFCATLTDKQVKGVLIHELYHVILGHPWRRDSRDPFGWNVATDYVINNKIVEWSTKMSRTGSSAPYELPDDCLQDPKYAKMCEEEVYAKLPKSKRQGPTNGKGKSPPSCGEFVDAPGTPAERQASFERTKLNVSQAREMARQAGKMPGDLDRDIDGALEPRVDWREKLRHFVTSTLKDDYSWRRPRLTHLSSDLVLPSLYGEGCGRIAVAIDTSGSISDDILQQFMSEIRSIVADVKPEAIEVMAVDADVQWSAVFENSDEVEVKPKGGGGTAFEPAFQHIEDRPPVCFVYLTDLQGSFPAEAPEYPVLWVATEPGEVPFGETVPIYKEV